MKLNIYDKLYPDSAPACIYGTPKMLKFSCSDSFPKLCLMVSSIGTFNYNLARFLCDLSPVVPNAKILFLLFLIFHFKKQLV